MWRIHFHLNGHEQEDDDDIDFEVGRVHITYQNLNYLKEQFGYGSRDYLYYKKRCGAVEATVQAINYWNNLNHAIMILLNWRYAIPTHILVTVVAPTCQ
jgi:hypothetical protein